MTMQLSAVTTPTFGSSVEGANILYEPVSGRLVLFTPTSAWYATDPDGPWTQGTGFGANWQFLFNAVTAGGIIVALGDHDTTASPNELGVAVSTDGGATWTPVLVNTTYTGSPYLAYDEGNSLFLIYQNDSPSDVLAKESAGGITWSAGANITAPVGWDVSGTRAVAGNGTSGTVVMTASTGAADGMLYSTDGGYTFLEGVISGNYDESYLSLLNFTVAPMWCGDRWVVAFYDGIGFGFLTSLDGQAWSTVRPAAMSGVTTYSGTFAWNDTEGWLCYSDQTDGTWLSSDFTTFVSVTLGDGYGMAWLGNEIVQAVVQASPPDTAPIRYATATNDTIISGLTHLEGKEVSVVNNGVVLASPNNAEYAPVIVTGGTITLAGPLTGTVTVGLPYTTDIQTLDIDSVGTTIKDRGVQVGGVICWVEDTGKFYAGPIVPTGDTLTGLEAFVPTNDQGYATTSNVTGVAEVTLQATYNNTGRVLIRQVDPTPLTILSIAPTGFLNGGR